MPYFHCNRCHHEWEGTKDDKICSWCNDKGYIEDGYILEEKTPLEKMLEGLMNEVSS